MVLNSNYLLAINFFKKSSQAKLALYFLTYILNIEDKMKAHRNTQSIFLNILSHYYCYYMVLLLLKLHIKIYSN